MKQLWLIGVNRNWNTLQNHEIFKLINNLSSGYIKDILHYLLGSETKVQGSLVRTYVANCLKRLNQLPHYLNSKSSLKHGQVQYIYTNIQPM